MAGLAVQHLNAHPDLGIRLSVAVLRGGVLEFVVAGQTRSRGQRTAA